MKDSAIIEEAIRLVQDGVKVTFPVKGRSMFPFIVGDRDSLILQKPHDLRVGHIILAFTSGADGMNAAARTNSYVIHRIVKISGRQVTLMGDGNLVAREFCSLSDVKALATHVVRCDQQAAKFLYSPVRSAASKLWTILRPFRKWLLLFCRILYKVHIL